MKKTTKNNNLSHNLYSEDNLLNTDPIYPYLVIANNQIYYYNSMQQVIDATENFNYPVCVFERPCPKAHAWRYYLHLYREKPKCSDTK